jgi:ABC-type lipoprotein export system ATPase subunit
MSQVSSMPRVPVVDAVDLRRRYGHGPATVVALANATCRIHVREQIALMGRSGSGKSTLVHLLAGIDTPNSGTVTWPALVDEPRIRPGPIGVVFQAPSLLSPLTVVENVALPLLLGGASDTEATAAAHEALELLELDTLANKLPEELSGGQAQRVAIARVLAGNPKLILADEPTGQLDHDTATHVIDVLIAATDASGAALLINTHDPVIAARFAIHWSMHDGTLTTAATRTTNTSETARTPC